MVEFESGFTKRGVAKQQSIWTEQTRRNRKVHLPAVNEVVKRYCTFRPPVEFRATCYPLIGNKYSRIVNLTFAIRTVLRAAETINEFYLVRPERDWPNLINDLKKGGRNRDRRK